MVAGCLGKYPLDDEDSTDQKGDSAVWNVESHGIRGDGNTDVGERVQELFDAVDRDGGGIVYLPPGRYLFERTPLVGDNTLLVGAGPSTVSENHNQPVDLLSITSNAGSPRINSSTPTVSVTSPKPTAG